MAYKPRKDIKVPESYIQKIRATKTKSAALAKYGDSNDPKMREALRRFYGDVGAPKPMGDSARAKASTLPRKSVAMKTVAQSKPSRTSTTPARGNTPYSPTKSTPKSSTATKKTSVQQPVRGLPGGVTMKKGDGAKVVKSYATIIGTVAPVGRAGMLGVNAIRNANAIRKGLPAAQATIKTAVKKAETRGAKIAAEKAAEKARLERNAKAAATRAANKKAAAKKATRASK
jgi:hypothetical protein